MIPVQSGKAYGEQDASFPYEPVNHMVDAGGERKAEKRVDTMTFRPKGCDFLAI